MRARELEGRRNHVGVCVADDLDLNFSGVYSPDSSDFIVYTVCGYYRAVRHPFRECCGGIDRVED